MPSAGSPDPPSTSSRRRFLALGAGGVVAAIAGFGLADLAAGGQLRRAALRARGADPAPSSAASSAAPHGPMVMTVLTPARAVGDGDLFISDMAEHDPKLVIASSAGEEVWSRSGARSYADFRLQSYHGRSVLTWWESNSTGLAA